VTGQITDAEARPLPDADVGLRGTAFVTRTDAAGSFQFVDVEPGRYLLDVARLGYAPFAREVAVTAGEEVKIEIQLIPIVIPQASYYRVHPFAGFLECALGSAAWVSPCSYPYTAAFIAARDGYCVEEPPAPPACTPKAVNGSQYGLPEDIQTNQWRYNFTVEPGAAEVVSEMMWTPASAAATTMVLVLSCAQYDPVLDNCSPTYADVEGKSPLRKAWKTDNLAPPQWVMSRTYLPFDGAQVALQQKFDVWNTVWYNAPAPEGWTILDESG
jgi:carboxypeptidase family protein